MIEFFCTDAKSLIGCKIHTFKKYPLILTPPLLKCSKMYYIYYIQKKVHIPRISSLEKIFSENKTIIYMQSVKCLLLNSKELKTT